MGVSRANGEANGIYYETEVTAAVPPHTHLHKYTYTDTFAQIQYQIQIFSFFTFPGIFFGSFHFPAQTLKLLNQFFSWPSYSIPHQVTFSWFLFFLVNMRMLCLHLGSAYPHIVPI